MNKLDTSIKVFSSIFTDTTDNMGEVLRNINSFEVNKLGCVSLYEIILAFNNLHEEFIKEYEALDKLDLGKKVDVNAFNVTEIDGVKNRSMRLLITDSKITEEADVDVYLFDNNSEINSIVTNADESYINGKEISLDNKKIKDLLDLFEKYYELFKLYTYLKCGIIISTGTFTLFTQIGNSLNDFTDNINTFKLNFGSSFINEPGDHYRISVRLGDELDLDMEDCKINLDGEDIDFTEEDCFKVLKEVYINGKYLNNLEIEEEKNKTK